MKQLGIQWRGTTLSEATLRVQDLAPRFIDVLKPQLSEDEWARFVRELPNELKNTDKTDIELPDEDSDLWNAEAVDWWFNEELFELMNQIAPRGTTFSSHEGDGSCYGFWSDYLIPEDVCSPEFLERIRYTAKMRTFDFALRDVLRSLYWPILNRARMTGNDSEVELAVNFETLREQLNMTFEEDQFQNDARSARII